MYEDLRTAYQSSELPSIMLGGILVQDQLIAETPVHLVLKSLNRHGLIAGATGSGKTKTIQVLSEQLSLLGVPSLVMDIKGDLSGLAASGVTNPSLVERSESLDLPWNARSFPCEFLSLDGAEEGIPLRATVFDFGSVLFARLLDVNDTQEGVITILFEYAKEEHIPLVDLADLKALLNFVQSATGKAKLAARYGSIAGSSIGPLMRKIIELEAQGADEFFGEPAFAVLDLVRVNEQGQGVISIVRLLDMQDKPKLFSTFMLKLLTDIYRTLPELGDPEKPKLMLFIDEAHLIFNQASKALLSLLDTVVKLIRSKGVGIIFCTQMPDDIPENILSQLGLKIQHALRAFTAKDRKAMKLVAQNFPPSPYYATEHLLTSLGIGQALVTGLDAKGQPTALIHCLLRAPESRMGVLTAAELAVEIKASPLLERYRKLPEGRVSAKSVLEKHDLGTSTEAPEPAVERSSTESVISAVTKNTLFRQIVRQVIRDVMKAIMHALRGSRKR